jgi:NADH-quinone oxidoreductase subunit N
MIPSLSLEITVLLLGILMLLVESFSRSDDKRGLAKMAIGILSALVGFSFFVDPASGNAFYAVDATAHFFKVLALLTTIVVLIMSLEYSSVLAKYLPGVTPGAGLGEFYSLPVFTCAGLMFMASAVDFLLIFVSLELVTISFYILVAYMRRHTASLEAGVKYLILGALSTGFLVYGITWIFGLTGETNLTKIGETLNAQYATHSVALVAPAAVEPPVSPEAAVFEGGSIKNPIFSTRQPAVPSPVPSPVPLLFGLMLLLTGLGFKVAAVPFQLWVPDVYQGAPTPITAFLSVGSKAAGFVVLLRVLQPFLGVPGVGVKVLAVLALMAALTMLYGNLAALPQDNFKRLLAYSSIGHAGYLLVAVASVSDTKATFGSAGVAVAFYLAGYLLMTLLSFLVLIVVARHSRGDDILHFNGLAKRSPFLAFALLAAMLSLAGIPFTAGFIGKFLVFAAAVQAGNFWLVGIGILTVAAGFYYYLRIVAAMYWQEPGDTTPITIAPLTRTAIGALTLAIFVFGIFPQPILRQLKDPAPLPTTPIHAAAR